MRLPLLAMLFALNAFAAFVPIPAVGAASSNFSVSSVTVQAGADATFIVARSNGGKGVYALVQTSDSSAHAGPDYVAVKQLLYFRGGELAKTVTVPTVVDQAAAGTTLSFNIGIAAGANDIAWGRGSIVEPAPNPQPATWVSAPLQDGGFARVKANDGLWDSTGPGAGRPLQAGEIVAVYFNGWESEADGRTAFAIYALADGTSGRAYASDLEGVAPVGSPPGLPADWWVPGLVTANKTCTDPRQGHEGQPGVTQAGIYRAAMLAGSHKALASGEIGSAAAMWQVFATGDQSHTAFTVVTGDCLVGS